MEVWDYLVYLFKNPNKLDLWDFVQYVLGQLGNMQQNDMVELILYLVLGILFLYLGFVVGSIMEVSHYKSIRQREAKWLHLPAVTSELEALYHEAHPMPPVTKVELTAATAVISEDYFKTVIAILKRYYGGNLTSYESLLDRARREAILRMKERVPNADIIVNMRLESSSVCKEGGDDGKGARSVEVLAYGTALTFQKSLPPETA
jgi:uncharacterized protein YbjQ (UPF0145 family)